MTSALTILGCLLIGLAFAFATPAILQRLTEPELGPEETKITYADLATPRFVGCIAVLSGAASVLVATTLPSSNWPAWLVLNTVGLLLAAIDARTTWLPRSLTRLGSLAMLLALAGGSFLGSPPAFLRGLAGAALSWTVFWLVWRGFRGGLGFGDVRFAPLVGAATAAASWELFVWSLVLGSLVGAVLGLIRLAIRRPGAFAYAPAILAGGYFALAVHRITG